MLTRKFLLSIVAVAAIGAALAACGGGRSADTAAATTAANADTTLTGSIVIDGSSTVAPLATLVAEKFQAQAPNVSVTVGTSGTGGGFAKFCNGETDVSNASRQIDADEQAACAAKGITFVELVVANDGIVLVTNKANTWVTCITTDELTTMWGPDSKATTWQDVNSSWPKESLKLFGPGTDSGTFDFFTKSINGEEGASRTDFSPSEDDNVTIKAVMGENGGVGYFGLSYYEQNKDQLNLLEVDAGAGCVAPDATTVQNATYTPLSRQLYMYVSKQSSQRPEVKALIDYYIANEATLTKEVLFVPLADQQLAEAKTTAAGLAG